MLKSSINGWTLAPSLNFEEAFKAAHNAGFDGIELTFDLPGKGAHAMSIETPDSVYSDILSLSEKYELPIVSVASSIGWTYHMGVPSQWDEVRRHFEGQLEAAVRLGAKGILTLPDGVSENRSFEKARENSLAFLETERTFIRDCGVIVGLENVWNRFFNSPYDMNSFIKDCANPNVKAYFDVGNVVAFSEPEYWIEVLEKNIGLIHIKGYKRAGTRINSGGEFCCLKAGTINWSAVTSALEKAGFDGYLTVEISKKKDDMRTDEEFYAEACADTVAIISGEQ